MPLGFYHLIAGTGQGVSSLARGRFEQAARELAPAALMVALYAGGRSSRYLAEPAVTGRSVRRPQSFALDVQSLKAVVDRLEGHLGDNAIRELVRYIQSSRDAGMLVAEGGELAAAALYEAGGNVPKARLAWLSEARSQRAGAASKERGAETSPRGAPSTDAPIRNARLAGEKHPVTGVPFDADGYPDFRAAGVVKAEVKIPYTGSRAGDFAAANKAAGLRETPKGMTWHHHQDRTTMQLVPTDLHARTGHTGGFSGQP
ncbi:HNH endonuclease [Pyxidicoccus trucidator]|uniref:HNH endonuclease n=1 Tax=Pyxidicoccus trucidator TaxID=2709662 RepID=UPI001F08673C|nr:HNH endonuclease [Pyxidicoccus trucidator]